MLPILFKQMEEKEDYGTGNYGDSIRSLQALVEKNNDEDKVFFFVGGTPNKLDDNPQHADLDICMAGGTLDTIGWSIFLAANENDQLASMLLHVAEAIKLNNIDKAKKASALTPEKE